MKSITWAEQNNKGFYAIPLWIEDEVIPTLSLAEQSLFRFILRRTWGWGRDNDYIAYSQMMKGTGMSRKTISRALRGLEDKVLVQRRRTPLYNHITVLVAVAVYKKKGMGQKETTDGSKGNNRWVKRKHTIYNQPIDKKPIDMENSKTNHTQQRLIEKHTGGDATELRAQNFLKWKKNLTKSKEWNKTE